MLFWEVRVRFWVRGVTLHQRGRKLSEGVSLGSGRVSFGLGFWYVRVLEGRTSCERGPLQVSRQMNQGLGSGGTFFPLGQELER
jgi:hypothetical protein